MADFIFKEDYLFIIPKGSEESLELETVFTAKEIRFTHQFKLSKKILQIPPDEVDRALYEIDAFRNENKNWHINQTHKERSSSPLSVTHVLVILVLAIFHWLTSQFDSSPLWKSNGMMASEKVIAGEWARTITALTLHSDFPHLLGNFVALWLFSAGLGYRLGDGITWLLILLSGILGNLANAYFYQSGHHSIGASTAVFGALGLLGVMQFKYYRHEPGNQFKKWVPLGASLGLFAMLGSNPSSDVTAHIFGLLAGLILGYVISLFERQSYQKNYIFQIAAFASFWGLILLSWKIQQAPYQDLFTF